jgi:PAS domain-containing protein
MAALIGGSEREASALRPRAGIRERMGGVPMNQLSTAEFQRQLAEMTGEIERLREALIQAESARDSMARAESDWQRVFAALPDFVTIVDCEHRIVRINNLMADRLNVSVDEAIGRPCFEVMHASGAPPAFCPHALAMADGRRHTAEIYEPTLDAFFLVTASPFLSADGTLAGSVHVARELPDRRAGVASLDAEGDDRQARFEAAMRLIPRMDATQSGRSGDVSCGKTFRSR